VTYRVDHGLGQRFALQEELMKVRLSLPILATVAVCTAACFPTEDSCNIKTPGIYVEFDVTETGNNARAKAVFWTGDSAGGTNLELTCGDTVIVNGVALEESGSNPIEYTASIDIADQYSFVFEREDEDPYTPAPWTTCPSRS
jgi:hypothetical protein